MNTVLAVPRRYASLWEPEPLHLPLDEGPHSDTRHKDQHRRKQHRNYPGYPYRESPEEDVPGSHVVVIDIS